jgi:asparagine synthetase B (glutamine-hydrolysing)
MYDELDTGFRRYDELAAGLAIVFNGEIYNYRELRADGHGPVGWG